MMFLKEERIVVKALRQYQCHGSKEIPKEFALRRQVVLSVTWLWRQLLQAASVHRWNLCLPDCSLTVSVSNGHSRVGKWCFLVQRLKLFTVQPILCAVHSLCQSQIGVLLKWLNVGSHEQCRTIAQGLQCAKNLLEIRTRSLPILLLLLLLLLHSFNGLSPGQPG